MRPAPRLAAPPDPPARPDLWADGALSVEAACAFLALGHTEVYRLMGTGELAWAKHGRRRLVSRRSAAAYLATLPTGATP